MFYVFLVGLSKATLRCYTSICDGIIVMFSTVNLTVKGSQVSRVATHKSLYYCLCIFVGQEMSPYHSDPVGTAKNFQGKHAREMCAFTSLSSTLVRWSLGKASM